LIDSQVAIWCRLLAAAARRVETGGESRSLFDIVGRSEQLLAQAAARAVSFWNPCTCRESLLGVSLYVVLALLDLPVETRDHCRQYVQFRRLFLREDSFMLQYLVDARYGSEESIDAVRPRMRFDILPNEQV
jgi:hypothetical protein